MDVPEVVAPEGAALDLLRRLGIKGAEEPVVMAVRRTLSRYPVHDLRSLAAEVRADAPRDPWQELQARYAQHGERLVELYRLTYLAERAMRARLNLAFSESDLGPAWHHRPKNYLHSPAQFAQETERDFGWSLTDEGPILNDEISASRFLDRLSLGHLKSIAVGPRKEFIRQLLADNGRPIDPDWFESGLRDMVNRRNDLAHFRHMDEANHRAARSWTVRLLLMLGWSEGEILAWAPRP